MADNNTLLPYDGILRFDAVYDAENQRPAAASAATGVYLGRFVLEQDTNKIYQKIYKTGIGYDWRYVSQLGNYVEKDEIVSIINDGNAKISYSKIDGTPNLSNYITADNLISKINEAADNSININKINGIDNYVTSASIIQTINSSREGIAISSAKISLSAGTGILINASTIAIDTTWLSQHTSENNVAYSAGTGITIDDSIINVNILTSGGLSFENSALCVNTGNGLIKNALSGAISVQTKANGGIKLDTNGLSVCDIYRQSTTTSTIVGFTGHTAESYIRKTDNIITGFNELYGQGYITGNGLAADITVIMRCDGSSTALDATQTLTNVTKVGMVRTYHRANTDALDDLGLVSVPLLKGTLADIPVLSFTATLASCGCGFIMEGYY